MVVDNITEDAIIVSLITHTEAHMKKALLVLSLIATNSFAYSEDPHETFDMTHNMTNKTTVVIRSVKNVQAACDAETLRITGKVFGYGVDACSFWNESATQCTIITGPSTNFHTLGHEMRHCIQGDFHSNKSN